MWNEYYRFTVERVKGVVGPLPTHHPFYVLLEASGGDAERIHADLEKLLEMAMGDNLILDATDVDLERVGDGDLAHPRFRRSNSAARFPYAARIGFDVSLAIDRMEEYADTIGTRIKQIDPQAFAIVFGHAGDGNLHVGVHHEHTPEKHDEFEKLVYGITGEFGGSISAEHGIGILKKPYLKMSRTAEEIETMRTLKRAMDPNNILESGADYFGVVSVIPGRERSSRTWNPEVVLTQSQSRRDSRVDASRRPGMAASGYPTFSTCARMAPFSIQPFDWA